MVSSPARIEPPAPEVALLSRPTRQPQPGLHLGRPGAGQDDVVDAPVGVQRDQAGLGDHREQRHPEAGGVQHPAGGPGLAQLGAGVDQHRVRAGPGDQGADVARRGAHRVRQQVERRQHRRWFACARGHQQQDLHTITSVPAARSAARDQLTRRSGGALRTCVGPGVADGRVTA